MEGGPGVVGVERHLGRLPVDLGRVELQVDGVQHHLRGGLDHLDVDGDLAGERGGVEVGLEHQVVGGRDHVGGQAVGVDHEAARYRRVATVGSAP